MRHLQAALATLWRTIHIAEDWTLVGLLSLMMLLAVVQMLLRNLGDTSIVWVDPFLRVAVLWMALLGACIAARDNDHISFDAATRFLPPRLARPVAVFTSLATAVLCVLVAWHATRFVAASREYGDIAFANVPAWTCQVAIPVAFGLIAIRYVILAVGIFRGTRPLFREERA